MTIRELTEVDARLEEAVRRMARVRPQEDRMTLYEEAAIAILDSEHGDFEEGVLEAHLMKRLQDLNA